MLHLMPNPMPVRRRISICAHELLLKWTAATALASSPKRRRCPRDLPQVSEAALLLTWAEWWYDTFVEFDELSIREGLVAHTWLLTELPEDVCVGDVHPKPNSCKEGDAGEVEHSCEPLIWYANLLQRIEFEGEGDRCTISEGGGAEGGGRRAEGRGAEG